MENAMKKNEILTGDVYKLLISLSMPLLFSNILNRIYDLTDAFFLGKIGGTQVAAITYAWPLINLIFSLGHGLGVAGSSIIAISIGKGIKREIDENVEQFMNLGIVSSVIIGIVCYIFTEDILYWLGTRGELLIESKKYMEVIFISTPFTFITTCYGALRKAEGKNVKASIVLSLSVVSNMIITPIFIFQLGMGIAGAAWGTLLAKFLAAAYCIYESTTSKDSLRYRITKRGFRLKRVREFVKIGFPSAFSQGTTSLGFVILSSYVRDYGTLILAAYGIGNKVNGIFFIPASVVSTALSTMIGQNYGAKNYERMKECLDKALRLGYIISAIGAAGIYFLSENIAGVFTKDPEVLYYSSIFMRIMSISLLGWGISQIYSGFFTGVKNTKITMFISIFRLWGARVPLFILLTKFNIREYAVWYAMCLSNLAVGFFSYFVYRINRKKYIMDKEY